MLTSLDVIGYYQVPMYNALGFKDGQDILLSGIYNCVGPLASTYFQSTIPLFRRPFESIC